MAGSKVPFELWLLLLFSEFYFACFFCSFPLALAVCGIKFPRSRVGIGAKSNVKTSLHCSMESTWDKF